MAGRLLGSVEDVEVETGEDSLVVHGMRMQGSLFVDVGGILKKINSEHWVDSFETGEDAFGCREARKEAIVERMGSELGSGSGCLECSSDWEQGMLGFRMMWTIKDGC